MRIRKAKIEDCKQVYELCKTKELVNPSGEPPKLWWIKSFVKEKQIFLVAEEKNRVAGFILGERTTGNIGYLWMLAVKKYFQGRGIGKLLMKEAEKESKKRKLKAIICYGFSNSEKVLKMLKNLNYDQGQKYYEFIKFL